MDEISILTLRGAELEPWLEHVAALRIRVFRDFPYLYDGSLEYEANYLRTYVESDSAVCVLALDGERVVGASTGLALSDETAEFRRPFEQAGIDTASIFYCAESVLLPEYRGSGVYRRFFRERERQAERLGMRICVFCAVQRPDDHPLRPADYQPLDPIWCHFGYAPRPDLITGFNWKDIDRAEASDKPMQFYLKALS
ncbi:GNAT family N-acetyltransferase [Marinobacterium sp. D7]|uniref:GNAT family N-acetyltransferase n=1 Tax=Marinobacterium ramblicola TaxID=2849041 RepID=UPI001C2DD8D2|nr:GNAT family N-acetyltransferase [Marinobacterium ramblicola]MBV1790227.1 GNAT family N-acetyltransferase [Marinobacterium ramblicola]